MSVDLLTLALAKKNKTVSPGTGTTTITDLSTKLLLRTLSGKFYNNTLTSIGMYALSYCYDLAQAEMPQCLTISNGAFRNCQQLTSAEFA